MKCFPLLFCQPGQSFLTYSPGPLRNFVVSAGCAIVELKETHVLAAAPLAEINRAWPHGRYVSNSKTEHVFEFDTPAEAAKCRNSLQERGVNATFLEVTTCAVKANSAEATVHLSQLLESVEREAGCASKSAGSSSGVRISFLGTLSLSLSLSLVVPGSLVVTRNCSCEAPCRIWVCETSGCSSWAAIAPVPSAASFNKAFGPLPLAAR